MKVYEPRPFLSDILYIKILFKILLNKNEHKQVINLFEKNENNKEMTVPKRKKKTRWDEH